MIASVSFLLASATAFTNVNGGDLERCSGRGMALTGFTRNGHCVDQNDDAGSHHVCIDMSSTTGGNFCSVTGLTERTRGTVAILSDVTLKRDAHALRHSDFE